MKVVVVDYERLAGAPEFPLLEVDRFGWEQYVGLEPAEAVERCWRADVVVTVATPLGERELAAMHKLLLVAVAGPVRGLVDLAAAQRRGVSVCHVPALDPGVVDDSQNICDEVIKNIAAFVRGEPRNRLV